MKIFFKIYTFRPLLRADDSAAASLCSESRSNFHVTLVTADLLETDRTTFLSLILWSRNVFFDCKKQAHQVPPKVPGTFNFSS